MGFVLLRAYDRAAIKFRGVDADINFNVSDYEEDMAQVKFWGLASTIMSYFLKIKLNKKVIQLFPFFFFFR